jgi:hypothetical protein
MYLFLKSLKFPSPASLLGSLTYAFSGFALCWLEHSHVNQVLIWIPLALLLINKHFQAKKVSYLLLLSPTLFLLITAGHFQTLTYALILIVSYFLSKFLTTNHQRLTTFFWLSFSFLLGLTLSAPQLLPTIEFTQHSIRFQEIYISQYNYGLLPIRNLITLLAPDYFGNPTTGNFWGFFNYQETIIYVGTIGLLAIIFTLYQKHRPRTITFFLLFALLSLLFALDTPIGQLVYQLNTPGLSTSSAGRISVLFTISSSVLVAYFISSVTKSPSFFQLIRKFWGPLLALLTIIVITIGSRLYLNTSPIPIPELSTNLHVATRNLILPTFLLTATIFSFIFRKTTLFPILIGSLLIFDLFRFGWKYTPFTSKDFVFPTTPAINFLKNQPGIFRVDREHGEVFPPNTWTAYGLMNPSGYDPMAYAPYVRKYNLDLNLSDSQTLTRYSELTHYHAKNLGQYNVKYLMVAKRDEKGQIPGNLINPKIDPQNWQIVFETENVAILENLHFQPRAQLLHPKTKEALGQVTITDYQSNSVALTYNSPQASQLILRDTYYPGWRATINDQPTKIEPYQDIFRSISIPQGSGAIQFLYRPSSFYTGLKISLASLLLWTILLIRTHKQTWNLHPKT